MISIILPTYNMEEYLAECLDSIVNQTYKDLEIICVNDASTDNSVVIMQEYAKKDSRIKIINNERNRGLGGARNAGFEVAQGEYVMCVDTDDKLDLRAIELMHKTLKENNADMAFCDMLLYNNDDKTVNVEKPFHDKALSKNNIFCLPDRLYDFTYIWPSTNKMYRKTVIDDNNIRFFENILYEDHTFYYTFLSCSKKVCYVSEPLYVYRIKRQDSIMHESTPRVFEIFTMLDKISDVIYRVFPTEIATTVMPRLAVRLIWERTWHLSGKTKKQFIKTARKYLSKYSKKDLLK